MSQVKSGRKVRPHPSHYSKPVDCTKFLIVIIFFASIGGIVYLSFQTNDPISFGLGIVVGFVWLIAFYLLWKFVPPSHWKRG